MNPQSTVQLTKEQVQAYAVGALGNPVLMGLLVELRASAMRAAFAGSGTVAPEDIYQARGQYQAADRMQNRLGQYARGEIPMEPTDVQPA